MDWFFSSNIPNVEVFDVSYFTYLIGAILCAALIIYRRHWIRQNIQKTFIIFLALAVSQRILINVWYLINDIYTLENSLPFQICRVVVWLIIIQFFLRNKHLDQVIFYLGIFAIAAFIYPIGIFPFYNIAGIAFFIMHAINALYPLAMFVGGRFVPTYQGAILSALVFTGYYGLMLIINHFLEANYFFIHSRPFLHDLSLINYSLANILGTTAGFIVICFIIRFFIKRIK